MGKKARINTAKRTEWMKAKLTIDYKTKDSPEKVMTVVYQVIRWQPDSIAQAITFELEDEVNGGTELVVVPLANIQSYRVGKRKELPEGDLSVN